MLQVFYRNLHDHVDTIFCYGNIINDLDKVICSARPTSSRQSTAYNFEVTIVGDITENILENFYKQVFKLNPISHNFSISKVNDQYFGIGGVSMPSYKVALDTGRPGPANYAGIGEYRDGLYLLKSTNCEKWTQPIKIIDRDWGLRNECCVFDSQCSLLFDTSSNDYYLYCRWNPVVGVGIRKLQVFTTNNIDKWKNNAQEVKIDRPIYIYTAYVFKHNNKFIAIVRYYIDCTKGTNQAILKDTSRVGLLLSDDGINFRFCKDIMENYEFFKHGDVTQGHKIVDNKLVIYLLCQNGKLNEYTIDIF